MDNNLYNDLRLHYCRLDKENVKEFAYNIKGETIDSYIKSHQEEFKKWQEEKYLEKIIKESLGIKRSTTMEDIDKRIMLLESIKGGKMYEK